MCHPKYSMKNLVAVHKIKETLTMNRPAYIGMCILDLSKTLMYDFHYNYIKHNYGNKAKLLFTDTDSLTYEIETTDAYLNFWNDKDKFDNSDYPENSPYFNKTNKKVIGKFKDEAAGVPIVEFVGLRSKMYSYIKDNDEGGKTAKGIKKNIITKNIKHEDYKEVLFNNKQMHHTMKTIRVYLGVKTCEVFLCFVSIMFVLSFVLTSLLSFFYVTREGDRFLHRG